MERLVAPLQRWLRQMAEMSSTVQLRKLECTFYYFFIILAVTYLVLPSVVDMEKTPLYIAAAFSVLYDIGFYFLRFKIYVHFGFLLHSGVFASFLSVIFFESGFYKVGTAMIVIGILIVVLILVFASLGWRVIVENSTVEERANQARRNANARNNNPVVANGQVNQPNHVLANGDVNQPNHVLANGDVNHPIPALGNRQVNNPNQGLENGHVNANLGNGHAIQPREDPEDEVVQQEVDQVD